MTVLSMKDYLRKKHVFTHDDVIEEDSRMRLAAQAYACVMQPSIQRRADLEAAIIDRYANEEHPVDATMWHATAICHLLDGNPEVYLDLERMVQAREGDDDYLVLALSILVNDQRRSEDARSCAERLVGTTLRVLPYHDIAVDLARVVNEYHLGWSQEAFNQHLDLAKERARFTR